MSRYLVERDKILNGYASNSIVMEISEHLTALKENFDYYIIK